MSTIVSLVEGPCGVCSSLSYDFLALGIHLAENYTLNYVREEKGYACTSVAFFCFKVRVYAVECGSWQIEDFHEKDCHLSAGDRRPWAVSCCTTTSCDSFRRQLLDPGSCPVA